MSKTDRPEGKTRLQVMISSLVYAKLVAHVARKYGKVKGAISDAVEEAIKKYLSSES